MFTLNLIETLKITSSNSKQHPEHLLLFFFQSRFPPISIFPKMNVTETYEFFFNTCGGSPFLLAVIVIDVIIGYPLLGPLGKTAAIVFVNFT